MGPGRTRWRAAGDHLGAALPRTGELGVLDAVGDVRPELNRAYNPWDMLTEPDAVGDLLTRAGVGTAEVEAVAAVHELRSPEDFWTIVLGGGYRATHDALAPAERDLVRARVLAELAQPPVRELETNVIYAATTKPGARGASM